MTSKKELRRTMRFLRSDIAEERRLAAARYAFDYFITRVEGDVLSYVPFDHELDVTPLNALWAEEGRLLLPRIEGETLGIYRIHHLEKELVKGVWGVAEPDPAVCRREELSQIASILVPGVAFTEHGHRLGFGKGYYDRLLAQFKGITLGVGFKEQLISSFPGEEHDITLSEIHLF